MLRLRHGGRKNQLTVLGMHKVIHDACASYAGFAGSLDQIVRRLVKPTESVRHVAPVDAP